MQSSRAEAATAFDRIRPALQLYYQALSGKQAVVTGFDDIASRHLLNGTEAIRLPDSERLTWYRVALAHRAMHEELTVIQFRTSHARNLLLTPVSPLEIRRRRAQESEPQRVMRALPDRRIAVDCFVLLEDLRIDEIIARRFPGLAPELREIQGLEIRNRPEIDGLSGGAALLELLARRSLGWPGSVNLPPALMPAAEALTKLAASMTVPESTIDDVLNATVDACGLVTQHTLRSSTVDTELDVTVASAAWWRNKHASSAALDTRVEPIHYRDALGLRLSRPNMRAHTHANVDFEDVLLARILGQDPVELEGPASPNSVDLGQDDSLPHEVDGDEDATSGALARDGLGSYLYPEWDYRASTYRESWCLVRETPASTSGSTDIYRETVRERRALVAAIRRQFELIAPETLRRLRGVRDGDDLDIDAVVDALADLRAGVPPSDNVYIARERAQRDVAVVFLVDLSSSTLESVHSGGRLRRIFDVEREGLILLIEPLVRVGDVFGMYGFTGTSRRDVRFVVIKDINETLSADVIARLDGLRPVHTTRMGPAIRHGVTKLRGHQAGTRLLMIISDGRPFDVDYGQEYGQGAEVEYAIHDTRAALDEARAQGVRPFLLTVDAQGADYLGAMCGGIDYELLGDVAQLPERLAVLYQHLVTRTTPR